MELSATSSQLPPATDEEANKSPVVSLLSTSDEDSDSEPTLIIVSVSIISPHEKRGNHQTFMLRDVNLRSVKKTMDLFKQEL